LLNLTTKPLSVLDIKRDIFILSAKECRKYFQYSLFTSKPENRPKLIWKKMCICFQIFVWWISFDMQQCSFTTGMGNNVLFAFCVISTYAWAKNKATTATNLVPNFTIYPLIWSNVSWNGPVAIPAKDGHLNSVLYKSSQQ